MPTNLFIDANVLVAVINKEYPAFEGCARVLSLANNPNYELYCTTLSLGIAFYFAEKRFGRGKAKQKLQLFSEHLQIANCGINENKLALQIKDVYDYEDGLQYFAGINSGCKYLITLNTKVFGFAKIPVYQPIDFLLNIATKHF